MRLRRFPDLSVSLQTVYVGRSYTDVDHFGVYKCDETDYYQLTALHIAFARFFVQGQQWRDR